MEQSLFNEQIKKAQLLLAKNEAEQALNVGHELLQKYPYSVDVYLTLTLANQKLEKFKEALENINHAIVLKPTLEFAHLTRLEISKIISTNNEALGYCKESLKTLPNSSQLWYELSQIELESGNALLADQAFKKHLVLSASSNHLRLGIKAFFDRNYQESEKFVRQHLYNNPNDVNALRLLGEIALSLGVFEDAQRLFERVLSLAPNYFLARLNYAHVLNKRELSKLALEQINILEKINPNHPPILTIKAAILVKLGFYMEAIDIYLQLLAKRPNQPEIWASLGHTYKTIGNTTESIRSYHQAIAYNSEFGDAFWSLANLKTYQFSENEISHMECTYNKLKDKDSENLAQICFALGKAYESKGDVDKSFKFYELGNRIKGTLEPYNKAEIERLIENSKSFFPSTTKKSPTKKDLNITPIFIVGLPRSGSTLLEQILASHTLIDGTKELHDIIALARKLGNKKKKSDEDLYPKSISKLTEEEKHELGHKYIESSKHLRNGAPFFIDKMPNNFLHIGLIKCILPHAKIIDARRLAPSAGFSCFKQLFATGQSFSYDLTHIEHYYRNYKELMAFWKTQFPSDILTVHYEDVVTDTQNQLKKIFSFLDLDLEEQCLSFYNNKRAVATASAEQVREPINSKGLDAWHPYSKYLQNLISIK